MSDFDLGELWKEYLTQMAPNIKDKQAKTICENPNFSNLNRAVASCSSSCEGGNGDIFKNTGNKIPGIGIETLQKITKVLTSYDPDLII